MINKIKTACSILTLSLLTWTFFGCGGTGTASIPKASTSNAPANKPDKPADASKKSDKPVLKSEKKPDGGKTKSAKDVPVPDNWIYVYNSDKGYGFYVPEGSTGGAETVNGVNVFSASTPQPSDIGVLVVAYKNEKLSKEDLLNDAVKVLEALGEKVTPGKLHSESEDYSLADATSVGGSNNTKSKYKILVGTDVTDNYVMIVGTDEDKFAANEKVIDEIWGNFEMWSGGSSGNN